MKTFKVANYFRGKLYDEVLFQKRKLRYKKSKEIISIQNN